MADPERRVSIFINEDFICHQPTIEQGKAVATALRDAFKYLDDKCIGEAQKVTLVPYRESKKL